MPNHLQKIAAAAPEAKQMAAQGIAPQNLLDLKRQRWEAPSHIGVARRQPDPHARGDGKSWSMPAVQQIEDTLQRIQIDAGSNPYAPPV